MVALHVPGAPGHALELPAPWTLVFEVVDGEDRADLGVLMHPHRDHAGVPVMAMQHLGLPGIPSKFRGGAGKEGEAPVLVFSAIDALAIKNRMAHQIDGQAGLGVTGLIDREIGAHGLGAPHRLAGHIELRPELGVTRHDHAYVVTQIRQGWGQGSHHISHAADFHHRCAFGRSKEDAHQSPAMCGGLYGEIKAELLRECRCAHGQTDRGCLHQKALRSHGRPHGRWSSGGACHGSRRWCSP